MKNRVVLALLYICFSAPVAAQAPKPWLRLVNDEDGRTIQRFLTRWYEAWQSSQAATHPFCEGLVCPDPARTRDVHCHPEYLQLEMVVDQRTMLPKPHPRYVDAKRHIRSQHSRFSVCPAWYPDSAPPTSDERIAIDRALTAPQQAAMRAARDTLIAYLARAERRRPSDDRLVGQLVRFLVDQGDLGRAFEVSGNCGGSAWWCGALRGYVLGRGGALRLADSVYGVAVRAMPDSVRCQWTNMAALLDDDFRSEYSALPCAARDSVNRTIWWLAQPLYLDAWNERRVEHDIRTTLLALRTAFDRDERYEWRHEFGSDARIALVMRYGWPAYTWWDGKYTDLDHTNYLSDWRPQLREPPNEPYTTYEYTRGRLHVVPTARALRNPLAAHADDWELTERMWKPRDELVDQGWWPREHFAPHMPLVQLPEPQTVMLRRDRDALLAVALTLTADSSGRPLPGQTSPVSLIVTAHPDSLLPVAQADGAYNTPVALWGRIPARPALAAIEFRATQGARPGGRTRYAVVPPRPLATFTPDERGISPPAVLRLPRDGADIPITPDSALEILAPSLRVAAREPFGVYWETYGFAPTDTMEFSVWIERYTPQGILRRFTNSLRVTEDLNTPVVITWDEVPGAGRVHRISGGTVPIAARSVRVDISALPRGDYWLSVAARTAGRDAVRERIQITVE